MNDRTSIVDIDWDAAPAQLLDGDLSSLDPELAERLLQMADDPQMQFRAGELGIKPIVLVIAALAKSAAPQ
jgi:hypothetical protein